MGTLLFAQDAVAISPGMAIVAMITAVAVTGGLIAQIILQVLARKTALEAAQKVENVRTTLEMTDTTNKAKMDGLKKIAVATHTLVNNNMAIQLKLNGVVTRRLSDLTHDPVDIAAAEAAEKLYRDPEMKQAIVDSQTVKDREKEGV